jgi:hypothetical protein
LAEHSWHALGSTAFKGIVALASECAGRSGQSIRGSTECAVCAQGRVNPLGGMMTAKLGPKRGYLERNQSYFWLETPEHARTCL